MMSRLFLVALLAVLGVVSGFAPVANTASVVGEFHKSASDANREEGRHRIVDGGDGPSVVLSRGRRVDGTCAWDGGDGRSVHADRCVSANAIFVLGWGAPLAGPVDVGKQHMSCFVELTEKHDGW